MDGTLAIRISEGASLRAICASGSGGTAGTGGRGAGRGPRAGTSVTGPLGVALGGANAKDYTRNAGPVVLKFARLGSASAVIGFMIRDRRKAKEWK